MDEKQKSVLADIKFLLKANASIIKPYFGLMFWQLQEAESQLDPEEFTQHGMSMTLDSDADEILASFMTSYIQLWLSARDFNAASRFVAAELKMTADELIQSRQFWLEHRSK